MPIRTIVCTFCVIPLAVAVQAASGAILGFEGARIIHAVSPGGTVEGDENNNVMVGSAANDILNGNGGNDYIIGGRGNNDVLRGHNGNDILLADNYLVGDHNGDGMVNVIDTQIWNNHLGQSGVIVSPPGISYVPGDSNLDGTVDAADEPVSGETLATINNGVVGTSNDTLYGGPGNDLLYAGKGLEFLWGGTDADVFFVTEVQDLSFNNGTVIEDFSVAEGDVLDISSIMQAYDPLTDPLGDFLWVADTNGTGQAVIMVDQNGFSDGVHQYVPNILVTSIGGPYGGAATEAQLQQLVTSGVLRVVGVVPEPASLALAGTALLCSICRPRRHG